MPSLFGTVLYYNIAIYDVVHVHNINNNTIVQYYCTNFYIIIHDNYYATPKFTHYLLIWPYATQSQNSLKVSAC